MKISYSAVWDDTAALLRANGAAMIAIAGVFMFLPSLLLEYAFPAPDLTGLTQDEMLAARIAYLTDNALVLALGFVVGAAGTLAVLATLLGRGGTVGGAIVRALSLLVPYLLAQLAAAAILAGGLLAFIIPAFYLYGRLSVLGPAIAAEGLRNPLRAVRRSFALTRGNGWAATGMVILVLLPAYLLVTVVTWVVGSVFLIVAGQAVGGLLTLILGTALVTLMLLLVPAVTAALYRALATPPITGS